MAAKMEAKYYKSLYLWIYSSYQYNIGVYEQVYTCEESYSNSIEALKLCGDAHFFYKWP